MSVSDRIEIARGDITEETTEAIVNAANTDLILGAGVAGAIRIKGGLSIQDECDRHGPVELGEAAITGAGKLKSRYVIHAAAMKLGGVPTSKSIEDATRNSLEIARDRAIETISFPALGTGIGGFSPVDAAEIMLKISIEFLEKHEKPLKIRFVLFDDKTGEVFRDTLNRLKSR